MDFAGIEKLMKVESDSADKQKYEQQRQELLKLRDFISEYEISYEAMGPSKLAV